MEKLGIISKSIFTFYINIETAFSLVQGAVSGNIHDWSFTKVKIASTADTWI